MVYNVIESGPEISVIMPNYNNAKYVSPAIESVLGQSFKDFELLVVDDGSTDDSVQIAQRYSSKDVRVKVIGMTQRRGSGAARNLGIAHSHGREICFLDSDDLYHKDKLASQLGLLRGTEEPVVVYCDWWRVGEGGEALGPSRRVHPTSDGRIFSEALSTAYGGIVMCMIPRSCLDKIGTFDESLLWAEDLDLLLRLASEFDFKYINKALYGYRRTETSKRVVMDRHQRLLFEALVTERHLRAAESHLDDSTKRKVESNLVRYYALTGQRRKMLRYGLRSWEGFRRMLSLAVRPKSP